MGAMKEVNGLITNCLFWDTWGMKDVRSCDITAGHFAILFVLFAEL